MHPQASKQTKQPRMKDSCEECAKSKLKCSKDKPICRRCQKRGINCQYTPSRRAGRTCTTGTRAVQPQRQESPMTPQVSGSTSPTAFIQQTQVEDDAAQELICETLSSFQDAMRQDGCGFGFSGYAGEAMSLDSTIPDGMRFPMLGNLDFTSGYFSSDGEISSLQTHSEEATDFEYLNAVQCKITSSQPLSPSPQSDITHNETQTETTSDRPHNCCHIALESLSALQAPGRNVSTKSSARPANTESDLPTINEIVDTNRATIDIISRTLICSCVLEENLVVLISLICFKILAWYAAVIRGSVLPKEESASICGDNGNDCDVANYPEKVAQGPTTVGKYHIGGDNHTRMRAHLVLSELHRIQRFLEVLSKRLKHPRTATDQRPDGTTTPVSTISASIFVQFEADLRRRLLNVSGQAMELLNEER